MNQNLNQLKIFYTVAVEGNISSAAKKLFISQPAISMALAKLEESFDVTLLKRSARGVSLTYEGEMLFEQLETAFSAIETGEQKLKDIKNLGLGKIKIGASSSLCKYILIPLLKKYIEENPHIKVVIECQSSAKSLQLLENGRLDIALVVNPENNIKTDFLPIGEFEDVFIANKTYIDNLKLREKRELSTNEILKAGNLMLLDEENLSRVFVDKYLRENNIEANGIIEVTSMDLLIDFAKIGMGISCVIKQFVQEDLKNGSITELKLETPMNKRTIGFAYPALKSRGDSVNAFLDFIKRNI